MFDYNKYSMESDYLAYINELRIATDAIIGGNVMYRAFSMKNGFDANYMHRAMSHERKWNPKLSTLELIAHEARSSLPALSRRAKLHKQPHYKSRPPQVHLLHHPTQAHSSIDPRKRHEAQCTRDTPVRKPPQRARHPHLQVTPQERLHDWDDTILILQRST